MRIRVTTAVLALLAATSAAAQQPAAATKQPAFGVCTPRSQRAGRAVGCFTITDRPVGTLGSAPVFWHVAKIRGATERRRAKRDTTHGATIIDAFGGWWLLTLGDSAWHPRIGKPVATIGPLPLTAGLAYSALYMEASMTPGMKSAIHRHSGPEAWYTLSGETCLETPAGAETGRASGPPVIVPGGPPMELTATGTTIRRSIVLILHDASKPPTMMETSWKPRGLCKQ